VLLIVAPLSILLGGVQLMQQQTLKRVLAFSSVAQMGYILLGLGLATPPALAAAALYALHHALVKSALFLGAGVIVWRTHHYRLDELGGLARRMPVTCALIVLASVGLAGLPPGSGFVSKALIEEAASAAGYAPLGWLAVLGSVFTCAGLVRLLWLAFAARPGRAPQDVREAPVRMLLPMVALVALSYAIGLYPQWALEHLAGPAAAALGDRAHYIAAVLAPAGVAVTRLPPASIEAPSMLAPAHWLVLLIVAVGGGLLAYALLKPISPRHVLARLARPIGQWAGDWHSGIVTDYALWTALGTAIVTIVLLANSS
jgi:formate hydrogenlyase subunit 3/multisubunit Na+/H+ antiporter MnhD subunit